MNQMNNDYKITQIDDKLMTLADEVSNITSIIKDLGDSITEPPCIFEDDIGKVNIFETAVSKAQYIQKLTGTIMQKSIMIDNLTGQIEKIEQPNNTNL